MRNLLLLLLLLVLHRTAFGQDTVAFYFAAHEDDWQLFMSPSVYRDVQARSTKVVFVYLTAGDNGAGTGNAGRSLPYYLARENGAKLSTMFITSANAEPAVPTDTAVVVGGHALERWLYGRTVSYFWRLPDGDMDGSGYAGTGMQSLRRLHEGSIATISAIDGSASYAAWPALTETLRGLIDRERGDATNVWVNVPEIDAVKNPRDHSDHQLVARAVLDAIRDLPCVNRAFYVDYAAAMLDENLAAPDREIKAGAFAAVAAGLNAMDHPGNWDAQHRALLSRHYVRAVPGIGGCFR